MDLKALWNRQQVAEASEEEIIQKAAKVQAAHRNRSLLLILAFVITIAGMGFTWKSSDMQWLASKIGVSLVMLTLVFIILYTGKNLFPLKKGNTALNVSDYLGQLLKLKQQQEFTQTTVMKAYYIVLSTGIFLFMLEPCSHMQPVGRLLAYSATAAWILFNWLYTRPRSIRKQNAPLNEAIARLREFSGSLHQEN